MKPEKNAFSAFRALWKKYAFRGDSGPGYQLIHILMGKTHSCENTHKE